MLSFFVYLSLFISFLCIFLMGIQYVIDKRYREEANKFFDEYRYSQLLVAFIFFVPFMNCYILFLEIASMVEFIQEIK